MPESKYVVLQSWLNVLQNHSAQYFHVTTMQVVCYLKISSQC